MFADAEAYERFMGRWSRLLAPLLIDFADPAQSGGILDVGCGTGVLARAIAGRRPNCDVVGIDPSKAYIAYASAQNANSRIRFETGDAQQLSFKDGTFAASLSLLVFNFIPDSRKALGELRRVTVPGGKIAAAVWDYSEGMRMLRVFFDAAVAADPAAEKIDEKHMPLCRAGQLQNLWQQAGLKNVEERPITISMNFKSFEDYWNPFVTGQGPSGAYVRGLTDDARARLRAEVKRRLPIKTETDAFTLQARAWGVRGEVPR